MEGPASPLPTWRRAIGALARWRPPVFAALAFVVVASLHGRPEVAAGTDAGDVLGVLWWVLAAPLAVAGLCAIGTLADRLPAGPLRAAPWVAGALLAFLWVEALVVVGVVDAVVDLRRPGGCLTSWRTPLWFVAVRVALEYAIPFVWDEPLTVAMRPFVEATDLPFRVQGALVIGVCLAPLVRVPLLSWAVAAGLWLVVPEALYAVAILDVLGDFRARVAGVAPSWLAARLGRWLPWAVAVACVAAASVARADEPAAECRWIVTPGREAAIVRRLSELGSAGSWKPGDLRVQGGTVRAAFDTPRGRLELEVRHVACALPGDRVGPRLACRLLGPAASLLPPDSADSLCLSDREGELPFESIGEPPAPPAERSWLRDVRVALARVLAARPPGFWDLLAWIGLALLVVPFALLWPARGALAPVDPAHRRWLLAILVASAAWRALVPASGFFMEAHQARDLGAQTNYTGSLYLLYRWLLDLGCDLAPQDLLFVAQRAIGWLTVPMTFALTLVLFRRQTLALVATAFVAFLPMHVKFGASESLTISTGYLWAAIVLAGALWIGHRVWAALVLAAVLVPVLAASRQEGIWEAAVAVGVVAAWGVRETGRRGALRLATFLAASIGTTVAFNPMWMTPDRVAFHNNVGLPGGTTWWLLLRKHVMRLTSPRWNAFLDPRVTPLPYHVFLLAGIARRPADRDDTWRLLLPLAALLGSALPYMLDIHGNVRPFGESRYHAAVVVPASWLAAEGALRARAWLSGLRRPAWLARAGAWRAILALVALNLLALVPMLRATDYDMPMEQAFLANLAADPDLPDLRAVLHPPDDDTARDLNRCPSTLERLRRLRTGEEVRSIVVYELDRWGALTPWLAPEGLYYYHGLYCHVMAETCAALEERLDLVPVRRREIPANPYNHVSQVRGYEGTIELALYRVVGIDGYPVP